MTRLGRQASEQNDIGNSIPYIVNIYSVDPAMARSAVTK